MNVEEIKNYINLVARKFEYNQELTDALMKCVPAMAEGRTEEEIKLLMDTLYRVEIFVFDEPPEKAIVDEITRQKLHGRNENVTLVEMGKGEYEKRGANSAYVSEPVFDDNMNIIDRIGFIYVTTLPSRSQNTEQMYGSRINLSYLIHELGHAWASQQGEYVQEENGNYTMNFGTSTVQNVVNRETHTATETEISGLYVEEAINSVEEEDGLCRALGIQSIKEIPGYIYSNYQGAMANTLREYMAYFGYSAFRDIRLFKKSEKIDEIQQLIEKTDFIQQMESPEYESSKRSDMMSFLQSSMADDTKGILVDFFNTYEDVYFKPKTHNGLIGYLDSVMEQFYDFDTIKYKFDVLSEDIFERYKQMRQTIFNEGYRPLRQVERMIDKKEQTKDEQER